MVDLTTTIGGLSFPSCVMNASGPRSTTLQELLDIGASDSGAIVMKSCTLQPLDGNPEPRYLDLPYGSLSSMGLPNLGYRSYIEYSNILQSKFSKPIIASVSGLDFKETLEIIATFNKTQIAMLELNLSCPNIGKPQIAYDLVQMDKILSEATDLCHKPLGVKLPPYIDSVQIERVAKVLLAHPIAFINCINNLPLCLWVNVPEETASIKPNNGIGGLGGTYIKPLALGNISKFYKLTQGKIDIIGTGGVESGQDAFEMLLAGAKAVQVGTAFMKIGTSVFTKITQELTTLIQNKGYHTIQQFNGKLRLL